MSASFFLGRKRKHLDFFASWTSYSLEYKYWVWDLSHIFPLVGLFLCLQYWDPLLKGNNAFPPGEWCLYSGVSVLFRLQTQAPWGKAFLLGKGTRVYDLFLTKVKGRILFIRSCPWNLIMKKTSEDFPEGCMVSSQGIQGGLVVMWGYTASSQARWPGSGAS